MKWAPTFSLLRITHYNTPKMTILANALTYAKVDWYKKITWKRYK